MPQACGGGGGGGGGGLRLLPYQLTSESQTRFCDNPECISGLYCNIEGVAGIYIASWTNHSEYNNNGLSD